MRAYRACSTTPAGGPGPPAGCAHRPGASGDHVAGIFSRGPGGRWWPPIAFKNLQLLYLEDLRASFGLADKLCCWDGAVMFEKGGPVGETTIRR